MVNRFMISISISYREISNDNVFLSRNHEIAISNRIKHWIFCDSKRGFESIQQVFTHYKSEMPLNRSEHIPLNNIQNTIYSPGC